MENWTPEKIKFELSAKGFTLAKVSDVSGVSYQTVSNSLRVRSPSGEKAISEILGVSASEVWPTRYFERANFVANLTEEQMTALDDSSELPERRRSWSRVKIERAIAEKGFHDLRALENYSDLALGSISQAASRKSVKTDRLISKIVGEPVERIFPHRYWLGGDEIPKHFQIEDVSDETFDKLKREVGSLATKRLAEGKTVNDDGTFDHPFYEQQPERDVPSRADQRFDVSLPPGVFIDE